MPTSRSDEPGPGPIVRAVIGLALGAVAGTVAATVIPPGRPAGGVDDEHEE